MENMRNKVRSSHIINVPETLPKTCLLRWLHLKFVCFTKYFRLVSRIHFSFSVVTGYMYKYSRFLSQKNPIDLGEIIKSEVFFFSNTYNYPTK